MSTADCRYDFLSIQVNIDNIPNYNHTKKHGIHVHEYGDMTDGCESMGGHYNPFGNTHGSPWHPFNARHVGDLGNFARRGRGKERYGKIQRRHVDYMASLYGPTSIIGRGIVLHKDEDDLGLKPKDPESLKTGNAGARLACCVIGTSKTIDTTYFNLYR
ncbi:uncharacterized protein LOC123550919 isoform X2 [Mercenaria mercenaria]|uniref:uncharacterized protein LOC123550919 isoform X2 n=1 Tax=Mercenaria mercenaria TaxID=6596 RepID=UPI00234E3D75|nr:uncharacterized protein LOC123550919 isoform X2 [Mercenaria mercenaria]